MSFPRSLSGRKPRARTREIPALFSLEENSTVVVIFGGYNPPYAYRTLQVDLDMGLLLPCNVIVYEADDKKAQVSAINPISALEVIKNEELRKIALEVAEKLERVIEKTAG